MLKLWKKCFLTTALQNQKCFRNYHTRRALLYVPGDDERKLKKTLSLPNVDCVAFDCEDGVAQNRKSEARETIANFFNCTELNTTTDWAVRVNSCDSGHLADDLKVIFSQSVTPKTIFLPKVDSFEDLTQFTEYLKSAYTNTNKTPIELIFYAESCRAIMNLKENCRCAFKLSAEFGIFQPVGIVFGSDDFCASLGATRSPESNEILYARQKVVLIAKAFDMQAIDMVYIDFKDDIGLEKQSREGSLLGYTGKQVIHPKQIDIVQKAFLPTPNKIQWATELLAAYESFQKTGKGAFVFRNQMIDAPTMKQAQNILSQSQKNT